MVSYIGVFSPMFVMFVLRPKRDTDRGSQLCLANDISYEIDNPNNFKEITKSYNSYNH